MPESEWLPLVRTNAIAMMMAMIRDDLAALNVKHDVFFSERSLIEGGDQVGADHRGVARERRRSMKAGCRRRRARRSTITRTASRRCSAPPPSATTSTGR